MASVNNNVVEISRRILAEQEANLMPKGQPTAVARIPVENAQPKVRKIIKNEAS
jgi:hypothetical protein